MGNKWVWIPKVAIKAIQAELLREHGGAPGIVDEGQLESTLARAANLVAYGNPGPDIAELAAAYGFGFARNHPFADGNKRVALAAIDVFLQMNGFELIVEEPEAVVVIQDLAAGRIEEAELAAWIRGHILELRDE